MEITSGEVTKIKLKVLENKSLIYKELEEKNSSKSIWAGRPDLLIFKMDKKDNSIKNITLGEVKIINREN